MIEKITGVIDPADDSIIERLINQDPAVREMWLSISDEVKSAESLGFSINVDAVDEQRQWNKLASQLPGHSLRLLRRPALRILAAACAVGVVVMGTWWLSGAKITQPLGTMISQAQPSARFPTLELPGHNIILLDSNGPKQFKVGDAVFNAGGSSLTYTRAKKSSQDWILKVPPGSGFKITLSDGTRVWLNASSVLKFPGNFIGNTRELSVEGEAFFEVAKNIERPFIVHTPATEVLVTGTSFNVNTYNKNKVQTALVEGAVILRNSRTDSYKLQPGFEAHVTDQFLFETRPFDSSEVLSWMKGVYYFRNTPLKELSAVIKRWYDVETVFSDSDLENKTFSGELKKNQPLQTFLGNLNLSGDIHCVLLDGKVQFSNP